MRANYRKVKSFKALFYLDNSQKNKFSSEVIFFNEVFLCFFPLGSAGLVKTVSCRKTEDFLKQKSKYESTLDVTANLSCTIFLSIVADHKTMFQGNNVL